MTFRLRAILFAALCVTLAAGHPSAARADARGRPVEALMAEYTRLWSAKDAHAIWTRIYRLDPGQPVKSEADLAAGFDKLVASGYDHSELQSAHACLLTPTFALAVLRFSRLRADGTPLPPRDRASAYLLRQFEDGWRVTQLLPLNTSARLDCASTTDR